LEPLVLAVPSLQPVLQISRLAMLVALVATQVLAALSWQTAALVALAELRIGQDKYKSLEHQLVAPPELQGMSFGGR
jgi:hypothetical protein